MVKVINKEQLLTWLQQLNEEFNLIAPVKIQKGNKIRIEYANPENLGEIDLTRRPDNSTKGFLLPQNEKMEEKQSSKQTLLFAVRGCDLEAVRVMDDVFLDEQIAQDAYYKKHRQEIIMIGYSCSEKLNSCFCDSLGIDPVDTDQVPVMLYQFGERFWLKANDPEYQFLLEGLPEGDENELVNLLQQRRESLIDEQLTLNLPQPLPEQTLFTADFWEGIAEKCLSCGICTFYCPTCYCFGFFWEAGEKFRNWDSCMFASFTKHASGHNPRPAKEQRFRQRIMHKYSYHPENYNRLACVGCGRCLENCPVNLDIRQGLKKIESYLTEKEGR